MTSKPLLAALLALAAPAAAEITVASLNGTIQIKTEKGVVTVKTGQELPPIPDGAEISVVEGDASFEAGGVAVKADTGDSFSVTGGKNGVQVAASGEKTSLQVTAGKSVATLGGGSTVSIASNRRGAIIAVMAGTASVSVEGRAPVTVGAGQSVRAPAAGPSRARRRAPESLPADKPKASAPPPSSPAQEKATVSPSAP